ncbi:MAG: potassium channel family protein [Marmoricola sp.]
MTTDPKTRRERRRALLRRSLAVLGLFVAYFCVPVGSDSTPVEVVVQAVGVLIGIGVLGWVLAIEVVHASEGAETRAVPALVLLLCLVVFAFALAFYLMEQVSPASFDGLHTRIDALYFTIVTMATVGYGDVHAEGQVARALVIGLIVFDVVIVASLVRVIPQLRRERRRE